MTEEIERIAAGNSGSGKEVMQLLLDQCGTDVVVTEGVVSDEARN